MKKTRSNSSVRVSPPSAFMSRTSTLTFWLLLASWGITWLVLLSLSNYQIMVPFLKLPFFTHVVLWLSVSFIAMVFFWRKIPEISGNQDDISVGTARICFWFFILLAAYLRLFDMHRVGSSIWDDHWIHTTDIRTLIDFHWHPLLFPSGQREPLFPYFTAFLWILAPRTPGLVIMQISNALIDISAIWVFYLLGKEIDGRRMGLILMAIGAISKIMIETTKDQVGADTCVLGSAIALLFTLRFLKKMDFKHAVEWGLALGFGAYCYVPTRPWMPVLLGLVWLWIFSDKKERHFEFYRVILGPGLLLIWALLFTDKNGFITSKWLIDVLTNGWSQAICVLILAFGFIQAFLTEKRGEFSKLFKWAIAAVIIALVMCPLYLDSYYDAHVAGISVFSPNFSPNQQDSIRSLLINIHQVMPLFFGPSGFPMCFPAARDSMYGFLEAALGLLGLAYFVARPSLIKIFVFILFWIGWIPGILSNAPYPLRYLTCDTTLFLTGAWGFNRLWLTALRIPKAKWVKWIVTLLVFACGFWQLSTNFNLYQQWMANRGPNPLVADIVQQELPQHRVYLVYYNDNFWSVVQTLLCDGEDVYKAGEKNTIDLVKGQSGKDLAILVYAQDLASQKKLEKEFPGLAWEKTKILYMNPQPVDFVYCMEVPFHLIPQNTNDFFDVNYVSPWTWRRRYYGRYGVGRGLISYEDRTVHWNDPLSDPSVLNSILSVSIAGDWNVKTAGDYVFSVVTGNVYKVILDHRKIMYIPQYDLTHSRSVTVYLNPGIHHVKVVSAFNQHPGIDPLMVKAPDASQAIPLDDLAAQGVLTSPNSTVKKGIKE